MTPLQMYFLLLLDSIKGTFIFLIFLFGVILFFELAALFIEYDETPWDDVPLKLKKLVIKKGIVFLICIFFVNVIPSTKQMSAIILVPKLINNEKIQNITNNSLNILEEKTKEYLNDLTKEKNK